MRARSAFAVLVTLLVFLAAGCGGGEPAQAPPPAEPTTTTATPAATTPAVGGATTVGSGQAETIEDVPFSLNTEQPVPPDFRAAYNRPSLIAVHFFKAGQDPFYPQGLGVDEEVSASLERLRPQYPTVEFFSYEIGNPGTAQSGEELEDGQYGTLATQLGVGLTPFVAMLAPEGEGYVITNLFQGYTPEPVLNQALFDLSAIQIEDNTSDLDVTMERVELTRTGGGLEYVELRNRSGQPINLQGFTIGVLDPATGETNPDGGATITDDVPVEPGRTVTVGRAADVVDADGDRVAGVFEGDADLDLGPGDQVVLLDSGGAVTDSTTI